jgi:hypothetical protein
MKIPELTPQRQKMLMGAAAAGLLLVLGFSFAPKLEVADETSDEVDEVLAIVADDHGPQAEPEKAIEPRPFRRPRSLSNADGSTPSKRIERPSELPLAKADAEESAAAAPARVVPPAYQQRLELLAEEEAELVRHQRQGSAKGASAAEPVPTVTVASVEAIESKSNEVEHALAEARRPNRWRRVELIEGTAAQPAAKSAQPRGAWLSGSIEIE